MALALPKSKLYEANASSAAAWQADLIKLFHHAKERYADVVWELVSEEETEGEEVWGHKGKPTSCCLVVIAQDAFVLRSLLSVDIFRLYLTLHNSHCLCKSPDKLPSALLFLSTRPVSHSRLLWRRHWSRRVIFLTSARSPFTSRQPHARYNERHARCLSISLSSWGYPSPYNIHQPSSVR